MDRNGDGGLGITAVWQPVYYVHGVQEPGCRWQYRIEVCCADSVVGVCCLSGNHLWNLEVDPSYRRLGLGTLLMVGCGLIMPDIYLYVDFSDRAAIAFYEHCGLKRSRKRAEYVKMRGHIDVDTLLGEVPRKGLTFEISEQFPS